MQKTVRFLRHNCRRNFFSDNLECWFKFSVVDSSLVGTPRDVGSVHTLVVTLTDRLMNNWDLAGAEWSVITKDMVKVAFQNAEDYIAEQLQEGPLPEGELPPIFRNTENSPKYCPYNLSNILYPEKEVFTVDIDEPASQSLRTCLEDFARYIQSEMRMSFWRRTREGYKWVSHPEQRAKDLLRTFLNARFGDSTYAFEEIRAGAGVLDVFVVLPNGEKSVIELKMCGHGYSQSWAQGGLEQLSHYMANKGTEIGYLVVFDSRVRDFSKGFKPVQTVSGMSVNTIVSDLRPYVKQKDVPEDV
jgi:hypothetical protein